MWRFEALRKVPLLAGLPADARLKLCGAFASKKFAAGEIVVRAGEVGDAFFVVEKGAVAVLGGAGGAEELARLGPGAYFGERALLRGEPRAATVCASADSTLLALGRADFEALLGPLREALSCGAAAYDGALAVAKLAGPLKAADFAHVAALGAGAFGRVTLVRHKGRAYALKALSKAHVVASGLAAHVKREAALQAGFASPFVVNMAAAFQDAATLYMVLELVQGGEFFAHLQGRAGALSEKDARFYAGCVVLGLEYLHDRGVAWRCVGRIGVGLLTGAERSSLTALGGQYHHFHSSRPCSIAMPRNLRPRRAPRAATLSPRTCSSTRRAT
jgi:cGMP-dependent protein kinase